MPTLLTSIKSYLIRGAPTMELALAGLHIVIDGSILCSGWENTEGIQVVCKDHLFKETLVDCPPGSFEKYSISRVL